MDELFVCIDPGHGGDDPGAEAGGIAEKSITLKYGLALRDELLSRGHHVRMTRNSDVYPGLGERTELANREGAHCFVSLHANANLAQKVNGAWVLHAEGSAHGKALADAIFDELEKIEGATDEDFTEEVYPDASGWTGHRRLAVLRKTKMPAVLVELGFITNDEDRAFLLKVENQRRVVEAIADGLECWARGPTMFINTIKE